MERIKYSVGIRISGANATRLIKAGYHRRETSRDIPGKDWPLSHIMGDCKFLPFQL